MKLKIRSRKSFIMTDSIIDSVSLETISVQDDSFGKDIESIVTEIQQIYNKLTTNGTITSSDIGIAFNKEVSAKGDYIPRLEKLIYKRLGINVSVVIDTFTCGAIFIFPVSTNNIFIDDVYKNDTYFKRQVSDTRIKNQDKGTIDLNKAKVGGIFSTYKHKLMISFFLNFVNKLTPGEITAILLHEIGHAFTWYEYSDRLSSSNQILTNIFEEISKPDEKRNYTYIYKSAKEANISKEDIDDILKQKNRVVMNNAFFIEFSKSFFKETATGKYDQTSSEQLADQFASRFGYGRELILALDKSIGVYSPERNLILFMFSLIVDISFLCISVTHPLLFICPIVFIYLLRYSAKDMTYDNVMFRYKRLRQDAIQILKKGYYNTDDTSILIGQIKDIDKMMEDIFPSFSLFTSIGNFILPSSINVKKDIDKQKLLESLANNDLFLKASELKTIS